MTRPGARGFEAFDISVLGAGDHVWVSAQSRQGSVFGVSRKWPQFMLRGAFGTPSRWLTDAIRHALPVERDARTIGNALTDLVFGIPQVAALLSRSRGVAGLEGSQLLVQILAAPEQVSSWPWELLLDPQAPATFLTRSRDVHVVRSGRSRTYMVRAAPIEPPLNVLMVMSSPLPSGSDTATPFDLYSEKRSLLADLQPLVDRGLLAVEVEDRPTTEQLRARMAAQRRGFHALHYLGHAQPNGLRLEDTAGYGRLVEGARFAALLQQLPDLRLAVFAGCETARVPEDSLAADDVYSTADLCVRDACPMVVGMQAVLPFGSERIFTRFFYQALTGGQPVAEALRLARLAIADDEFSGGELLNWAVPCLFVGGSEPGPLTDPKARATPASPRPQLGRRVDVRQGELRFIARLNELRNAVDVLGGRGEARLLVVWGPPGTGKTGLLDRALEELDPAIPYLFVPAPRLLREADPVAALASLVAERLRAAGRRVPSGHRRSGDDWWQLLVETLVQTRFALVIDDADPFGGSSQAATSLVMALNQLTARRGLARVAVAAGQELSSLTAELRREQFRSIRLQALLWDEIWQWIRRNLPVLTRFDEGELRGWFAKLPNLQQWEELAQQVTTSATSPEAIPDLVKQLAGGRTQATPPPVFGSAEPSIQADVGQPRRVLRVAVAGPLLVGREDEFCTSVTTLAAEHGVAGRVASSDSPTLEASLAEMLALGTPFDTSGTASMADITAWLARARSAAADVILLDFGSPEPSHIWDDLLRALAAEGKLVIAAGGNEPEPTYPAWCSAALAVGAMGKDGLPEPYSVYFPDVDKPELYAPGSVAGTALAPAVLDPTTRGTSIAALNAVAAAILVWSTDRSLSAGEVRDTLLETAVTVKTAASGIRRMDVAAALARTRQHMLLDALEWGPLERGELIAEAGLQHKLADPLIASLEQEGRLRPLNEGGAVRFENPQAVYLEFARLRRESHGPARTAALDTLASRIAQLAGSRHFTSGTVRALWESREDNRRIVALGIIQAVPELADLDIIIAGITEARSPFEQLQAFAAAEAIVGALDNTSRARLRTAVDAARSPVSSISLDQESGERADHLTTVLDDAHT